MRAPASRVRADLTRALRDAGFKVTRETTTLIEARRGSQLAASISAEKLPLVAGCGSRRGREACDVQVHLEDAWRSPLNKVYGLNGKYDRVFQGVLARLDAELGRIDPAAAAGFAAAATVSPMGDVALLERANAVYLDGTQKAAGRGRPPRCWAAASPTRRRRGGASPTCGSSRARRRWSSTSRRPRPCSRSPRSSARSPPACRSTSCARSRAWPPASSSRWRAAPPCPTCSSRAASAHAVDFLRQQAALREDMPVRQLLVCRDCRFEKIVNADYQRLAERNRKLGLLMGGVGATIGPGGVNPFVIFGQLFRLKKLDPEFVCPRCQGMQNDPFVVTFCPKCGERHQEGALRGCRCGHDFRAQAIGLLAQRIKAAKEAAAARALAAEAAAARAAEEARIAEEAAAAQAAAAAEAAAAQAAVQAAAAAAALPPPSSPTLALEIETPGTPPRTVTVDAVLVMGREEGDVILDDRRVSRQHLRLTPRRDGVLLEDLGSSNGTSVNGTRVGGPLLLRGGETVRARADRRPRRRRDPQRPDGDRRAADRLTGRPTRRRRAARRGPRARTSACGRRGRTRWS